MSDENRSAVAPLQGTVPAPRNLGLAPALRGRRLTKRCSGVTVVDADTLTGSIRAVIGDNGACTASGVSAVRARSDQPSAGNAGPARWARAR